MFAAGSRFIDWLVRNRERIQTIGIGLFLYQAFNVAYDYGFYPIALACWGVKMGGLIAFGGSLVQNLVMFWAYDYMKIDWLGAYALRELEDKENKTWFERTAAWLGKKNKTPKEAVLTVFLFLAMLTRMDPLIVAVHFQTDHFQGLKWKDWGIIILAIIVGNLWWLPQAGLVGIPIHYIISGKIIN